jgi:methylated-DNA-[protein]-cysteine S-methyltransferase
MNDIGERLSRTVDAWTGDGPAEAAARFADKAAKLNLIEVAYALVPSPLGDLVIAATGRGMVRLSYEAESLEQVLTDLSRTISPRVLELPSRLDDARRQLDRYFNGGLRDFTLPLDFRSARGFSRRVLEATRRIPYGEVISYRQIAERAGSPAAVRAAGTALGANPVPVVVPCHRVVRSDGRISGYVGGAARKKMLLELEGATGAGGDRILG